MNIEEVDELTAPIIQKIKEIGVKMIDGKPPSVEELPDFYPTYKMAIKYSDRIKIHAEICGFPKELFLKRAPNQSDREFDYMEGNFKQSTLPVYIDHKSSLTRPFNDGNWSIDYKVQEDEISKKEGTLQDYLETGIRTFGSLENYVKEKVVHLKTVDAMGVIGVKPREIPILKPEDGEGEVEYKIDNSKLVSPQPYYYSSRQILSAPEFDDKYFILWSNEKSIVEHAGKNQAVGHVIEVYDEDVVWRVEQTGKFTDYEFKTSQYFIHNKHQIPVKRLKGIPKIVGDDVIWLSPFLYACDLLDLALINLNYLECSDKNVMFPYRVALGNKCNYQYKDDDGNISPCTDGNVHDTVLGRFIKCPSCNGSTLKDRVTPMGQMLISPSDMFQEGETRLAGNAMYYVSPGTEPSKYMLEKIQMYEDRARKILHLQTSNSVVKGTENLTATGMALDVKAMYAYIKGISDQVFALYEFMIDHIGWQRYGENYVKPQLTYPVTFDFNTEQDYLNQINEAQKAGLAPFVIHSIIFKYLQTLYYNEKQTSEVFYLIVTTDRFLTLTNTDLLLKHSRGFAEKWEVVLHDSAINFVGELVKENPNFFEQKISEQQSQLIKKAKVTAGAIGATSTQPALGGGAIDSVGKLPLALQQLGLAVQRADESGNTALSKKLQDKMAELVKEL